MATVALFLIINALVLVNAVIHHPRQGHDAADQMNYIRALTAERALPTCQATGHCCVSPRPYTLPGSRR